VNNRGNWINNQVDIMSRASTTLREKALFAYRRVLVEKREEYQLYKPLRIQEALRLKLENLFGTEHVIEIEEEAGEFVLGAVIEEFSFLGIKKPEGGINVVWVEPCPHCGHQMPSKPLTSVTELGQELVLFGMTGKINDHACSEQD
jgi:hypothetical protein